RRAARHPHARHDGDRGRPPHEHARRPARDRVHDRVRRVRARGVRVARNRLFAEAGTPRAAALRARPRGAADRAAARAALRRPGAARAPRAHRGSGPRAAEADPAAGRAVLPRGAEVRDRVSRARRGPDRRVAPPAGRGVRRAVRPRAPQPARRSRAHRGARACGGRQLRRQASRSRRAAAGQPPAARGSEAAAAGPLNRGKRAPVPDPTAVVRMSEEHPPASESLEPRQPAATVARDAELAAVEPGTEPFAATPPDAAPAAAAAKPRRRVPLLAGAAAALLVAAIGAAALFWSQARETERAASRAQAEVAAALDALRADLGRVEQRAGALAAEVERALDAERRAREALAARVDSLPGRLAELDRRPAAAQGAPFEARTDWLRTEAEYYLAA